MIPLHSSPCELIQLLRQYLKSDPAQIHSRNSYGDTLLHLAMYNSTLCKDKSSFLSFLHLMAQYAADFNQRNNSGYTPLHM